MEDRVSVGKQESMDEKIVCLGVKIILANQIRVEGVNALAEEIHHLHHRCLSLL